MPEKPRPRRPPFPFDAIYKSVFGHASAMGDLLHRYLAVPNGPVAPEFLAALDLATLTKLPTEWVTRNFRNRRGDQVWRVSFTAEAKRRGMPRWLFVHLEFQSKEDRVMALRFVEYGGELYRELSGSGALDGEPCAILCVVVYNGHARWRAAASVPGLLDLPRALGNAPEPSLPLACIYPWGYHAVDFTRHRNDEHVPGSVVSMAIGLEYAAPELFDGSYDGPIWETARDIDDRALRETMARWLLKLATRYGLELPGLERHMRLEEVGPMTSRLAERLDTAFFDRFDEGWRQGIEQGVEQGVERQRALLVRMAGLRFGADVRGQVAAALAAAQDDELERAADLIAGSETRRELLNGMASQ